MHLWDEGMSGWSVGDSLSTETGPEAVKAPLRSLSSNQEVIGSH